MNDFSHILASEGREEQYVLWHDAPLAGGDPDMDLRVLFLFPAIEGIRTQAIILDSWLRAKGPSEHADLECAASAMLSEYERHTGIACTSLDLTATQGDAAAHVLVMGRWVAIVAIRIEETSGASDKVASRTGPRCIRFGDGTLMYLPGRGRQRCTWPCRVRVTSPYT